MNTYIFQADIYCEECGNILRQELRRWGQAPANPDDQSYYDSDEYPKGPYPDGGGEADTPHHCAMGPDCLNALQLSDGSKVGAFLENPLTSRGYSYIENEFVENDSEVVRMWLDFYDVPYNPEGACPDCGHIRGHSRLCGDGWDAAVFGDGDDEPEAETYDGEYEDDTE